MKQNGVSNIDRWANDVPISCVGAVDTTLTIRGSIYAIPREAPGGTMTGDQALKIATKVRDKTSWGFGAQFAADDAKVLSVHGYLSIELFQDSCPAGPQTSH